MTNASEIIFIVEQDPEGGLTARALGESIFTEADTFEELKSEIKNALRSHYETEAEIPKIVRLHRVHDKIFSYVQGPP